LQVTTPRLYLIAATATLARADASDRLRFAALLQSEIPPSWPPSVLAEVQEYFAEQLENGFALPSWWSWYAIAREGRILIGSGGLAGQPDSNGTVTLGYSITPGFEGKGYATEMVAGLLHWMAGTGRVKRVHATTFDRHTASVRILEKCGFECRGVSSEDAGASDEDRQGRGKLMLFVHEGF
jgi:[ribosomal protein S5]-alanine N-acetyltransferase